MPVHKSVVAKANDFLTSLSLHFELAFVPSVS